MKVIEINFCRLWWNFASLFSSLVYFKLALASTAIFLLVYSTVKEVWFFLGRERRQLVWCKDYAFSFARCSFSASHEKLASNHLGSTLGSRVYVANQGHCYIVNSLRTWEYPIGDPVQFLNWFLAWKWGCVLLWPEVIFSPRRFGPRQRGLAAKYRSEKNILWNPGYLGRAWNRQWTVGGILWFTHFYLELLVLSVWY